MKKTIDIPEKDEVLIKLKIRAAKKNMFLNHYIREVLIKHVEND